MEVNEKLYRPITEVNYLRAENADRYRAIMRFFYHEHERIRYWLYKEDVYEEMKEQRKAAADNVVAAEGTVVEEDAAAAPEMKVCPVCGNASDGKFCPQCGAPMGE